MPRSSHAPSARSERFGAVPLARAIEDLEALMRRTAAEDSCSRRIVQTELARQLALTGRSDEAWAKLEGLSATPVPDGDARPRVRFLLVCAAVAQLRYGIESARTYVAEARTALGVGYDHALEVDILCAELSVADMASRGEVARRLAALHAATGISRARVYAGIFDETAEVAAAVRVSELEEDRAGARAGGGCVPGRADRGAQRGAAGKHRRALIRPGRSGGRGRRPLLPGAGPRGAHGEPRPRGNSSSRGVTRKAQR